MLGLAGRPVAINARASASPAENRHPDWSAARAKPSSASLDMPLRTPPVQLFRGRDGEVHRGVGEPGDDPVPEARVTESPASATRAPPPEPQHPTPAQRVTRLRSGSIRNRPRTAPGWTTLTVSARSARHPPGCVQRSRTAVSIACNSSRLRRASSHPSTERSRVSTVTDPPEAAPQSTVSRAPSAATIGRRPRAPDHAVAPDLAVELVRARPADQRVVAPAAEGLAGAKRSRIPADQSPRSPP